MLSLQCNCNLYAICAHTVILLAFTGSVYECKIFLINDSRLLVASVKSKHARVTLNVYCTICLYYCNILTRI
jgi:hypothetical protein